MGRIVFRLLLPAFVCLASISAQETVYTLKVDVPVVSLDVSVADSSGNPVRDLDTKDFLIYEDGVPQEIRFFSHVSAPYNVLLLFDRSGSTQHKWLFMQRAVAGFIASLRPQDRVAIASFDEEFEMHARWTDDRAKALSAIPELIRPKAIGGTSFYAALERSLRGEFKKVAGRRAVMVLTDGRDTSLYRELVRRNRLLDVSTDRSFQKVFRAVKEQRVPVYFVALNTDRNFEPNPNGGDEFRNLQIIFPNSPIPHQFLHQVRTRMEQLADISGGRILFPERMEDVIQLYERIGQELGVSYSLGYVPSNPAPNGAYRRIEVETRNAGLRLTQSRAGYYAR